MANLPSNQKPKYTKDDPNSTDANLPWHIYHRSLQLFAEILHLLSFVFGFMHLLNETSILSLNCFKIWHGTVSRKCHNPFLASQRDRQSESSGQHDSKDTITIHPFPHGHRNAPFSFCLHFLQRLAHTPLIMPQVKVSALWL